MSPNLDSPAAASSTASNSKTLTDFSIAAIIGDFELNLKDNCSNHSETVLDLRKVSMTSCESSNAHSPASSTITTTSSSSGASSAEPTTGNNKKFRPKNFTCPLCKMAYSNNGQLKNHVRIHTGERPFQCTYLDCNKSFTRNEELTRHKLIHTGVRPHSCNYCGKKFGRKDHLKKHVRTHDRKQEFQRKVFQVVCGQPAAPVRPKEEHSSPAPKQQQQQQHSQQVQACGGCFCC